MRDIPGSDGEHDALGDRLLDLPRFHDRIFDGTENCRAVRLVGFAAGSFRSRSISLGFLGLLFAGIPVGFEFGCGLCFVRAALFGGEGFGVGSISLGASGFLGSFCGGIDSGLLFFCSAAAFSAASF